MKKLLFSAVLLLILAVQTPGSARAPRPRDTEVPPLTGKINLVWQHADEPSVDLSRLDKVQGLNVVSPCWYVIANEYGQVADRSVEGYVQRATRGATGSGPSSRTASTRNGRAAS